MRDQYQQGHLVKKEDGKLQEDYQKLPQKLKKIIEEGKNQQSLNLQMFDMSKLPFAKVQTKTNFCSYYLRQNEYYYLCRNCAYSYSNIYCFNCFDFNKHKGHSVEKQRSYGGDGAFCDCGRTDRLKQQSFCSKHSDYSVQIKCEIKEEDKNQFLSLLSSLFQFGLSHNKSLIMKLSRYLRQLNQNSVYYNRLTFQFLYLKSTSNNKNYAGRTYMEIMGQMTQIKPLLNHLCNDLVTKKMFLKLVCSELSQKDFQREESSLQKYDIMRQVMNEAAIIKLIEEGYYHQIFFRQTSQKRMKKQIKKVILNQKLKRCKSIRELNELKQLIIEKQIATKLLQKIFQLFPKQQDIKEYCSKNKLTYTLQFVKKIIRGSQDIQDDIPHSILVGIRLIFCCIKQIQNTLEIRKVLGESSLDVGRFEQILQLVVQRINDVMCCQQTQYQYQAEGNKLFSDTMIMLFLIIMQSPKKQHLIKTLLNKAFMSTDVNQDQHNNQMGKLIQKLMNIIANLFQADVWVIMNQNRIRRQLSSAESCQEEQSKLMLTWIKYYLYQKKKLDTEQIVRLIRSGFPKDVRLGAILDQLCTYNQSQSQFSYCSPKIFKSQLLKFLTYKTYQEIMEGCQIYYKQQLYIQKYPVATKLVQSLVLNSEIILNRANQQWDKLNLAQNKDEIKSSGYFYILFLIIFDSLTQSKNTQVKTKIQTLIKDPNLITQYCNSQSEICLIRKLLKINNTQLKPQIKQVYRNSQQQLRKAKAQEKKRKIAEKYEKNRLKMLERSTSFKNNQILDEDQTCIICRDKTKMGNQLVVLAQISKNNLFINTLYGQNKPIQLYLKTCFHSIHLNCFIKQQKDSNHQFNCPLCQTNCNIFLPQNYNKQNKRLNKIFENSIIASMVSKYNQYQPEDFFSLVFSHLIVSKSLVPFISHSLYIKKKKNWLRRDQYLETMIQDIYQDGTETQKQVFKNHIQKIILQINMCCDQNFKMVQTLFSQALKYIIIQGTQDKTQQILLKLRQRIRKQQFQIIRQQLSQLMQRQYQLPLQDQKHQVLQKSGLFIQLYPLPQKSSQCLKLFEDVQCQKCKQEQINIICLSCKAKYCQNCFSNHSRDFHAQIQFFMQKSDLKIYSRNSNDSIYQNFIKINYQDLRNFKQFEDDECYLNKSKLQKLIQKVLQN